MSTLRGTLKNFYYYTGEAKERDHSIQFEVKMSDLQIQVLPNSHKIIHSQNILIIL